MNYFGKPIQFIFSKDLNDNTAKGAGDLVYSHPIDFKHFKEVTMGNVVIMGYKTYMTLDKPLEGRLNVVYSELPLSTRELREGFISHQDSWEIIENEIVNLGADVFCIGGVQTFESLMRYLNSIPEVMYVTTYEMQAEDGNCPATFLDDIAHLYSMTVIHLDNELDIVRYSLDSHKV